MDSGNGYLEPIEGQSDVPAHHAYSTSSSRLYSSRASSLLLSQRLPHCLKGPKRCGHSRDGSPRYACHSRQLSEGLASAINTDFANPSPFHIIVALLDIVVELLNPGRGRRAMLGSSISREAFPRKEIS